ncbi:MAG TPA: glycosyltransferase N-terminal domain-containing protein, partial [Alphaproteobacteria bacterium]|nr:glycosyltransferase N-terminal domain-containing protein [Alphaproteobacteria bacterium]
MMLALYQGLTRCSGPFLRLYLARRQARGKEPLERLPERLGLASRARPEGALVWLHGASVGEALSALPLIERLLARHPSLSMLVTSGTVTSARILAERLPARALHQFAPVDHPGYVARFLDHWRPD